MGRARADLAVFEENAQFAVGFTDDLARHPLLLRVSHHHELRHGETGSSEAAGSGNAWSSSRRECTPAEVLINERSLSISGALKFNAGGGTRIT